MAAQRNRSTDGFSWLPFISKGYNLFLTNARPEEDSRYRSDSAARARSVNATAVLMDHGRKLACVLASARTVVLESFAETVCHSDVISVGVGNRVADVDIVEQAVLPVARRVVASNIRPHNTVRLRPQTLDYGETVFTSHCVRSEDWTRGDSNPRPETLQDMPLHA